MGEYPEALTKKINKWFGTNDQMVICVLEKNLKAYVEGTNCEGGNKCFTCL